VWIGPLYETGQFAAPIYRDMPFALAPNSWARMAGKRASTDAQRDHGDGLSHGLDTPEAIEELFWKHQCVREYIQKDHLIPHRPNKRIREDFTDYIRLILLRGERERYLSKNNNNMLRLDAIRAACPDAIILHPFRDPLQQAASLLNQHRRAMALAASDPFRVRYTASLAHYEFGPEHKPFCFNACQVTGDPDNLDYWLTRWIETYRYLQDSQVSGRHFIDFDRLAASGSFAAIATMTGTTDHQIALRPVPPKPHDVSTVQHNMIAIATALHGDLKRRSASLC
jgi:hypothetical protein